MRSRIKIVVLFLLLAPSLCLGAVADYIAICNTRPTLRIYDGYSARSWLRDEVRALQRRMNIYHDFKLVVDGYFGPGTKGAVQTFQRRVGIAADGIVGPITWSKLCTTTPPQPSCPEKGDWLRRQMPANAYILKAGVVKPEGSLLDMIDEVLRFFEKVKTGGDWDWKSNTFANTPCLKLYGKKVSNDVPGNVNYGFTGMAIGDELNTLSFGIDPELLLLGLAGYAHVKKDLSKNDIVDLLTNPNRNIMLVYLSAADDDLDQNAIQVGIDYFNNGGSLRTRILNADLRAPSRRLAGTDGASFTPSPPGGVGSFTSTTGFLLMGVVVVVILSRRRRSTKENADKVATAESDIELDHNIE